MHCIITETKLEDEEARRGKKPHLIKAAALQADVGTGDEINPWGQDEKLPGDNIFLHNLGGIKEYSGEEVPDSGCLVCLCVCCSRVACPMSSMEKWAPRASPVIYSLIWNVKLLVTDYKSNHSTA